MTETTSKTNYMVMEEPKYISHIRKDAAGSIVAFQSNGNFKNTSETLIISLDIKTIPAMKIEKALMV